MLPAQPNQSLIDGIACLQLLAGATEPIGTREVARQLGLETTRVSRLLKTLAHMGLLEQDDKRKFGPGPGVHVLAAQCLRGSNLLRRALPVLESIQRKRFALALGVLWQDKVCYLYYANHGTRAADAIGHAHFFPAHESGIGLAILATQTLKHAKQILGLNATPDVIDRLRQAKRDGYGLTAARENGHRSVGVALPDHTAAITYAGVFSDSQVSSLAAVLQRAANEIHQIT